MNKKNALLVYPEFATSFWSFKFTLQYLGKKSSMPSLGLLTLANMFPKDYNLRLVDMNVRSLTDDDLHWADLVCTSTMIVQRKSLEQVIVRAKWAGKPVVAGGPHPPLIGKKWRTLITSSLARSKKPSRAFSVTWRMARPGISMCHRRSRPSPRPPCRAMISSTCAHTAPCCCNSRVGVHLIASFVILPSCTAECRGPKPLSKCWQNSPCC